MDNLLTNDLGCPILLSTHLRSKMESNTRNSLSLSKAPSISIIKHGLQSFETALLVTNHPAL